LCFAANGPLSLIPPVCSGNILSKENAMIQNRTRTEDYSRRSASQAAPNWSSQCCQYIEDNPATSVLIGFGLGVGAGVLLSVLMQGSSDSYADRAESFAHRIGHQVRESLEDMIPKSWKNRLHS
jgi:hypothetical protein